MNSFRKFASIGLAIAAMSVALVPDLPAAAATPVTGQWGWGAGPTGNGSAHSTQTSTPEQIQIAGQIIAIEGGGEADGQRTAYALTADGKVWNWGGDAVGVDRAARFKPAVVPGLNNIVSIAAGSNTGYALKRDGTVWAWGDSGYGAFGDGGATDDSGPSQVVGINDAIAISDSAVVRSDGTVWTWGLHPNGALGTGANRYDNVPIQISGLAGVTAIAGYQATVAMRADGTIVANDSGTVRPLNLTNVTQISSGVYGVSTFAIS